MRARRLSATTVLEMGEDGKLEVSDRGTGSRRKQPLGATGVPARTYTPKQHTAGKARGSHKARSKSSTAGRKPLRPRQLNLPAGGERQLRMTSNF